MNLAMPTEIWPMVLRLVTDVFMDVDTPILI